MSIQTMSPGDQMALQHSIYTSLIAMYIAEYNIDYVASNLPWIKGDNFMKTKKQDRFRNIIKEYRSELLMSIESDKRQLLIDSLDEDRIMALNSIMMLINQIQNTDAIEVIEDHIAKLIKNNRD